MRSPRILGPALGLFYQIRPTILAPRSMNVTAGYDRGSMGWNAQDWDLRGGA